MQASVATIRASRDFDLPVAAVYAHWVDPTARQRWEAGPDTGMVYDRFDTRPGGTETVRILGDGQEVGHLVQTHHRVEENRLIASSMIGVFSGEVTMMTALIVEFSQTETGSRIEALAQAMDLTGRDIAAAQEAAWGWILDRFQADLAEFGTHWNPHKTPKEAP
jgi:uncharacterized protein YndB with AHSA1/START domain